jgi:hypothetical protein
LACNLQIDVNPNPHPDPAYHFDADPDPDPAYHFDADPNLDPAYHFYADADADPTFQFDAHPDLIHKTGSRNMLDTASLSCQPSWAEISTCLPPLYQCPPSF